MITPKRGMKNKANRETAEQAIITAWSDGKLPLEAYDDLMLLATSIGSDVDLGVVLNLLEITTKE